jgi:phage tail sheath protein FI
MPEYLAPGVYVEESHFGPKPIEGVGTSTAAFLGETERGPTRPRLVSSYQDYVRWFGGPFGNAKFMPFAVNGFFQNGGQRLYVSRVTGGTATCAQASFGPSFVVRAIGPGAWGRRVYAKVEHSSARKPAPNGSSVPIGFKLRLAYYATVPNGDPLDWFDDATKPPLPDVAETFDNLDLNEHSPNYYCAQLHGRSALAELIPTGHGTSPPAIQFAQLATDGMDAAASPEVADFEGQLQLPQRATPVGLAALELDDYRDVALVYAPGASVAVNNAVIDHCETLRYRFAVVDTERAVDITSFDPRTVLRDTRNAAVFCPWITVAAPGSGARVEVPPGGHVVGVYARTDAERGAFQAPANHALAGVVDLTVDISDRVQGLINARGVNAIRKVSGRGFRVWGTQTLSTDSLWKYVSVRRYSAFVERSVYEGTLWVVFEPNNERTWVRVRHIVSDFLFTQWRLGALQGQTPGDAFFVTCDRSTITEQDLNRGVLVCDVGFAPLRPAEFVIIHLLLMTAEAHG